MVEVLAGIVRHADFFHDAARAPIWDGRKGNNLREFQFIEAECQRRAGALGRVTIAPVFGGEPPTDFDGGCEVGFEWRMAKADESGKRRDADDLHGPQAEAVLVEVNLDAGGAGIALLTRQKAGEEFHHARIGIQFGVGGKILRTPSAKSQSVSD
jgi:hypothetical protein